MNEAREDGVSESDIRSEVPVTAQFGAQQVFDL